MKIINTILALVLFTVLLSAQVAPPTNLTATVIGNSTNHKSVKLTWQYGTPATNLIKFNIYKKNGPLSDTSAHFVRLTWTGMKSFIDNNVQMGHTYSYYVTAVRHDTQSVPSNMVEAEIVAPVINYGKISGHLFSDSSLAPIYRGRVEIISNSPSVHGGMTVMTDSNGWFSAKVKTGQYVIFTSAPHFFGEYYDNVRTRNLATTVTVNTNDSLLFEIGLEGITPPVFFTVSGTVKDSLGNPIKADLHAYSTARNFMPTPGPCNNYSVRTDSLGNYSFNVRQNDTIVIYANANNKAFFPQYYNDKTTFASADRIPVSANVGDINFILHAKPVYANGVSGNMMDSAGVTPLKGRVYIYRQVNGLIRYRAQTKTDTVTGAYSFINLEPGDYLLFGEAFGYKGTYFRYDGLPTLNWRNADSVVVTATGVVENINFRLKAHSHNGDAVVFGTIFTDRRETMDGAVNIIYNESREVVGSALTDVDGSYFVENLTAGNYTMVSSAVGFNDASVTFSIREEGQLVGDINATLKADGVTGSSDPSVINGYALSQNYPNPFNPSTVISYNLPQNTFVTLKIYNILGSEVVTLVNQEQTAGKYDIKFNASDLSSGIYLYKIQAGNFTSVKKLTLIK